VDYFVPLTRWLKDKNNVRGQWLKANVPGWKLFDSNPQEWRKSTVIFYDWQFAEIVIWLRNANEIPIVIDPHYSGGTGAALTTPTWYGARSHIIINDTVSLSSFFRLSVWGLASQTQVMFHEMGRYIPKLAVWGKDDQTDPLVQNIAYWDDTIWMLGDTAYDEIKNY
jgi:hypothetical protein